MKIGLIHLHYRKKGKNFLIEQCPVFQLSLLIFQKFVCNVLTHFLEHNLQPNLMIVSQLEKTLDLCFEWWC